MPDPDSDNLPVIRRRDGTIRTDIKPGELSPVRRDREPINVVGRQVPRPRRDPASIDLPTPARATGRATRIANNTRAWGHLFAVVLPRYLVASVVLGVVAGVGTGLLWLSLSAAALPLVVFGWWLNQVRRQAKEHRRGQAPPPPGWLGKLP
jgi:hypothetical protein